MHKQGTILVVDDNKDILLAVELLLRNYFERVVPLSSPNLLSTALRENPSTDIVLLDMNFSSGVNTGNEGLFWLKQIKEYDATIQVVLFTAYGDIELAVRAMKEGATDFVVKPFENERLIATLRSAYALRSSQKQVRHLTEVRNELSTGVPMYWGASAAMQELRSMVGKVAETDANVLLTGENGTGKEMLAREIHRLSLRRENLFVGVDMGSIPETLFESELFGHVRGAFTDAKSDRPGKFEMADRGTLFLDEIGNLPVHLQSKLLTVLQGRRVVRVGSNIPVPVNIRLITATNRDLSQAVVSGEFREDLLYRINTIHLELPPLRERKADIVPLAYMFLKKFAVKYGKQCQKIHAKAEQKLTAAPWCGNIRELEHAVEKAVILADADQTVLSDFMLSERRELPKTQVNTLEEMEVLMIRKAVRQYDGNLSAVASQLGITRQTLYNKMKKYNI